MTNRRNNRLKDYAKYSSLAFQMMSIIVIGTFGGLKLDQYTSIKFPIFTLCLSLLSVFIAIYIGIKDFLKK
ncbi:MAG: AtpZ/AtpI family protein [Bacteroidales bacterium]|nr:AtpZ/AtpI family protein [Bacteroidales bacterium]MDY0216869.1 AtpZ/AtpI family protein [Bacteroidales bacterium]